MQVGWKLGPRGKEVEHMVSRGGGLPMDERRRRIMRQLERVYHLGPPVVPKGREGGREGTLQSGPT